MTFTVSKADLPRTLKVLEGERDEVGFERVGADDKVVKISVIGVGMRSHAGIAHQMFATLADKGINIQAISTSEIKISVLIGEEYKELALRALHTAYGLDAGLSGMARIPAPRPPRPPLARGRRFLGSELAVMGGAMTWVSERNLVAAISEAGGFGVLACGSMPPDLLAAEIAGTRRLTDRPFGVNLIVMHPQLDRLVEVCLDLRVGHVVLAGGLPSRDADPRPEGQRRQGGLLRAQPRRRPQAGAQRGRRARHRGHGGGRPYRPGLDLGPGPGDPAARARGAGLRRRRDRPRRHGGGLSQHGGGGRADGHRLRLRHGVDRPPGLQAGLHPRQRARRRAVGAGRPASSG